MGTGPFRGVAVVVLCIAASLVCGCGGGGGGTDPAIVAGRWLGGLTLSFTTGASVPGSLELALDQEEAFVSGIAEWSAVDEPMSVVRPIDGGEVTLRLHFRCTEPETGAVRTESTVITATVDGPTMSFTGAAGLACFDGGVPNEVSGGSGSLTRTTDDRPL